MKKRGILMFRGLRMIPGPGGQLVRGAADLNKIFKPEETSVQELFDFMDINGANFGSIYMETEAEIEPDPSGQTH